MLTPGEVKKLLTYCETEEPTLTPYACLCVFGGLRPEREAPNMIDEDITAEAITVPEEFAKDNETRIIEPLSPNFIKWINHIKRREGSFQKVANLKRKWNKAKKVIGRDWPHDCLRHSYASYHFAEYNDAGLTAKNLGHPDSTLLRKDYNGAVTKAQAKAFWAVPADRLPLTAAKGKKLGLQLRCEGFLFVSVVFRAAVCNQPPTKTSTRTSNSDDIR